MINALLSAYISPLFVFSGFTTSLFLTTNVYSKRSMLQVFDEATSSHKLLRNKKFCRWVLKSYLIKYISLTVCLKRNFLKVGDFFHLHIKEVIRKRTSKEQKIVLSLEVIILSRFISRQSFWWILKLWIWNYIDGVVVFWSKYVLWSTISGLCLSSVTRMLLNRKSN